MAREAREIANTLSEEECDRLAAEAIRLIYGPEF